MGTSPVIRFFRELRRRRVFRTAALYIVGAWLVIQVADILFPVWGIAEAAINYLLAAALIGFPVALVFGWLFDIGAHGIRRTQPVGEQEIRESLSLKRTDYVTLAAFVVVAGVIIFNAVGKVLQTPAVEEARTVAVEVLENSIAVLPFSNMSNDPDNEFFCDGISEEILNRLASFADLHVIGRTSSFAFKDSGFDIPRMAAILGVQYLLQGSVRKDGNQLRISTQLLNAGGLQVWSNSFDRELRGVFQIQSEIAESVATNVAPKVSGQQGETREPDIEAYQHYLVGRELIVKRLPEYWIRGPEEFFRAVEIDPQFAAAHAELAIALTLSKGLLDDEATSYARAQKAIDTALKLEPDLARAYAAQGLLLRMRTPPDYPRAERMLRKSLELDPNAVDAMNWLAGALSTSGRVDEAVAVQESAVRIDPLAPVNNINLARYEFEAGRVAEAEQRLLRLLEIPHPSTMVYWRLSEIYMVTGRLVEALELNKRKVLEEVRGAASGWTGGLAGIYTMLGMWTAAEYWSERTMRTFTDRTYKELEPLYTWRRQGRFEDMKVVFDNLIAARNGDLSAIDSPRRSWYGTLQAFLGEFDRAIETIEGAQDIHDPGEHGVYNDTYHDGFHALAWAYLQTGEAEAAEEIFDVIDRYLQETESREGRFVDSRHIFFASQNALLRGKESLALDRLEQAFEAGWRDSNLLIHDPRWEAVRDNPRIKTLMARVETDIAGQRALVEQIEAEDDFVARLDSALGIDR